MTKRRKPLMAGGVVLIAVAGLVPLLPGVCILIGSSEVYVVLSGAALVLLGSLMAVLALRELLWQGSDYNVFRRSSTTAQATVFNRHTKTRQSTDANGLTTTTTLYWVTVQFDAVRSGGAVEKVSLEAKVSKKLYDCLRRGAKVKVRYAMENPRVAFFEGEEVGFYSQWLERCLGLKGT